jgi:carbon monoxide dehydrogenase subunit G
MRLAVAIEVAAPPQVVWEFVADPRRYLHFMSGVTRWECAGHAVDEHGEPEAGAEREAHELRRGSRCRTLMRVGSAEVGGTIEIVEANAPRDLAWNSVSGVDQRGRWRLRPRSGGRTRVEFRFAYGVAGSGLLGWIAEQVAAREVRGHLRRSLSQLKRQVEHEELRRAAARRRARAPAR